MVTREYINIQGLILEGDCGMDVCMIRCNIHIGRVFPARSHCFNIALYSVGIHGKYPIHVLSVIVWMCTQSQVHSNRYDVYTVHIYSVQCTLYKAT